MLRDSETVTAALLDDIEVNIYVKSAQRQYLYINPETARTFRLPRGHIIGRTDFELFPEPVAQHWRALDDKVFTTGAKQQAEESLAGPDGSVRYFWSTKVLLRRPGQDDCLLGYSIEITQVKQAELALKQLNEALLESEEKFRQAFSNANTGICLVDLRGRLLQVNDKMSEIFGFRRDELEGMTVNDLAVEDDKNISPDFIEHAVHGEKSQAVFEKRYRHKDGHVIYGLVSSSLVHDATGAPKFFVSQVQDITKNKQLESDMHLSEQRHRVLLENAREVLWAMNIDGTFGYVSRAVFDLGGYSAQEALQLHMDRFLAPESLATAHDYLGRVRQAINDHQEPPSFKSELLQRRKDGSLVWTEVLAYPITDTRGRLVEILGVSRDIDERKRHEHELQFAKDEAQAAKLALERANAALENANAELRYLASTDGLTGAENRRQFEMTISKHLALAKRHGKPLSLVMFDIDHFKDVNDTYGHNVGDQVLSELSGVVRSSLRAGDVYGRWGGEEFFILLPYCALDNGTKIAESLRQRLAQHEFSRVGHVTASFGVAQWRYDESDVEWIMRVDKLMYEAKGAGRNQVCTG